MKEAGVSKENGKPGRKREEELMLARKWEGECRVGCTSELCPSVMGGADMMSERTCSRTVHRGMGHREEVLWYQVRGQYHLSAGGKHLKAAGAVFPRARQT